MAQPLAPCSRRQQSAEVALRSIGVGQYQSSLGLKSIPWHDEMKSGKTSTDYFSRLTQGLEDEFQRDGPGTLYVFVAEPVVGTICFVPNLISRIISQMLDTRLCHSASWLFPSY